MLHDCLRRGCRHKNVILIVTNGSKKACLKVMKKEQVVDQKLSQLADFPLLCTHSGKVLINVLKRLLCATSTSDNSIQYF